MLDIADAKPTPKLDSNIEMGGYMPIKIAHRCLILAWMGALTTLATPLLAASPEESQLTSATARELWRKGSDQILAGDFHSAIATLEQVERLEPGRHDVADVITWMRDAETLAQSRERLRIRYYDHWVEESHKAVEEAKNLEKAGDTAKKSDGDEEEDGEDEENKYKWGVALRYATLAMVNAKDEDAFRTQPWLKEIEDNVLLEIDEAKKLNEWPEALALYGILKELHPDNADYEAGYHFCRKRAHLDFIYGPKSTWRTDLRDVRPDAIGEILRRIEMDYVDEIGLKKLCLSGLEHLLILAEAQPLTETFPTLGDEDLVGFFVARLKGLIKKKQRSKGKFQIRDVMWTFEQAMRANDDSLRLPEPVLVDEFVAGMLEPLDEFTAVIWPAEVDEFNKHTRGEFVGVGIQITKPEGQPVRVESPLADSPAYWAGIKPGDLITEVDGKSTMEITVMQAVRIITGEAGTIVNLTIKDPVTEQSRVVPLERQRIEIRTVGGHQRDDTKPTGWDYMIDPEHNIGYVRVSGFMDKTVDDLKGALDQMRGEDCQGLILDLRFNPGGLLTSARDMCELFLSEDKPIVKTKGRSRAQNTEIRSRSQENYGDLPLIVLVNEYSASASEIVAGALAGLKEACVIGDRTFGKGSVQNLIPISNNQAYLKLTTAHYYVHDSDLPGDDSWFCLHKRPHDKTWGIEPHVGVNVIPQEVIKILRIRRERDLLKGKDQAAIPKEILERRATTQPDLHLQEDEDPDTDPQIMTALNLMRIKLMSDQPWALAPRQEQKYTRANGNHTEDAKKKGNSQ